MIKKYKDGQGRTWVTDDQEEFIPSFTLLTCSTPGPAHNMKMYADTVERLCGPLTLFTPMAFVGVCAAGADMWYAASNLDILGSVTMTPSIERRGTWPLQRAQEIVEAFQLLGYKNAYLVEVAS